jgi:hypothetical protein
MRASNLVVEILVGLNFGLYDQQATTAWKSAKIQVR